MVDIIYILQNIFVPVALAELIFQMKFFLIKHFMIKPYAVVIVVRFFSLYSGCKRLLRLSKMFE